jgi:AcrR family transcriptional regulator
MASGGDGGGAAAGDVRDRIHLATVDIVYEGGYETLTVDAVVARAAVERAEFDHLFGGREELYIGLFAEIASRFEADVMAAFEEHEQWRDGLRACAYAAARHIRERPREVAFGVLRMYDAGELAQAYREVQLQRMVDLIDRGRQELEDPDSIGRGVAEGVIGSIYGVLVKELQGGRGVGSAESFVPDLMYMAVRPYLGHEIAREELALPAPRLPPPIWPGA